MQLNPDEIYFVEFERREDAAGQFWMDAIVDGQLHESIGPFYDEMACNVAIEDARQMLQECDATQTAPNLQ